MSGDHTGEAKAPALDHAPLGGLYLVETGFLIEGDPETVMGFDRAEESLTEFRRQFLGFVSGQAKTRSMEAKARRLLKRKAIGTGISAVEIRLRRNGPGRYVLADHIGVPNDTPQNVTIDDMIEWLQSQPAKTA